MANFTERLEYKLEVMPPYNTIQCREATIIEKEGVEVGRSYHRCVYSPGDGISEACDEVKKVAAALWTPAIIAEYEAATTTSEPPAE